nr:hypothetical protein [Tanacetum cinerariifolium]
MFLLVYVGNPNAYDSLKCVAHDPKDEIDGYEAVWIEGTGLEARTLLEDLEVHVGNPNAYDSLKCVAHDPKDEIDGFEAVWIEGTGLEARTLLEDLEVFGSNSPLPLLCDCVITYPSTRLKELDAPEALDSSFAGYKKESSSHA